MKCAREMYGIGKAIAPEKPFGFHMMQNMSLQPVLSRRRRLLAQEKQSRDYLKLATYNNAAARAWPLTWIA